MKTTASVLTLAMAALLCVPSVHAAKSPKTNPEAKQKMAEGLAALEKGENSAAISAFNKAVRKQGSVSTYFLLGWAHYQRSFKLGSTEAADKDDAQSAIDAYTMALNLDPSLKELPDASRLHFSMGLCQEAVGAYDKALDSYKMALRAAPNKALIPMHAARLRLKMKDEAKAVSNVELALQKAGKKEKALRDTVRRDPIFAPLIADVSTRKALSIEASDEGETVRDSVHDTTPRPAAPAQDQAVLEKIAEGNTEFKFRRYQSAVDAFNEALARNQERLTLSPVQLGLLHEKIGASYNKLGQAETSIGFLQKALQQNPLNVEAQYQLALSYAMSGQMTPSLHALDETFKACSGTSELRRYVLQAKTDAELTPVRDLPGFRASVAAHIGRLAKR